MEWYVGTLGLIGGIGTVISTLSRLAALRSRSFEERLIKVFSVWACSDAGKFFFRAYLREIKEDAKHAGTGE